MEKIDSFFGFHGKTVKSANKIFILKDDLVAYFQAIEKEFKVISTFKYSNKSTIQIKKMRSTLMS